MGGDGVWHTRRVPRPLCVSSVRASHAHSTHTGCVAEAPDDLVSARGPLPPLPVARPRPREPSHDARARPPQGLLEGTDAVPRADARGVHLLHLSRDRHVVPICLLTYDERASPRAHRRFSGTDTAAFRDARARPRAPRAQLTAIRLGPSFQSSQKASRARCRSSKTAARAACPRTSRTGRAFRARRSRDPPIPSGARALSWTAAVVARRCPDVHSGWLRGSPAVHTPRIE